MSKQRIKLKVFQQLCQHDCDFMSCWVPLPTMVIASILKISVYQCRKQMKRLVEDGLAERCSCILNSEESLLPYNGFMITAKGRKTDIYRYCALKSARICAECFDAKIESFLPEGFDMRWLGERREGE